MERQHKNATRTGPDLPIGSPSAGWRPHPHGVINASAVARSCSSHVVDAFAASKARTVLDDVCVPWEAQPAFSSPAREAALRAQLRKLRDELDLAATVQRNLMRTTLPEIDGAEIGVAHRPADVLSGDFYSTVRLNDSEIAISLTDATGHGVSAALLSASISHLLSGSVSAGGDAVDRFAPDDVLTRVNSVLLDADLQDCQFVTALYAVYNEQDRVLRWARGGAPYPLLVRQGQPPRPLTSDGPIVGICTDAQFEVVELQLEPGDTVIFHTDGLESFLEGDDSATGCCDLDRSAWFGNFGERPIGTQLKELQANLATMSPDDPKADDVTVVALHIAEVVTSRTESADVHTVCLAATACG